MKTKKSPQADIEPNKNRYFLIGLTFALAITLAAFEWRTFEYREVAGIERGTDYFDNSELPPLTARAQPKEIKQEFHKPKTIEIKVVDKKIEETVDDKKPDVEMPNFDPDPIDGFGIEKQVKEDLPAVDWAEIMPSFLCSVDSETEIFKYLAQHVKYPRMARENGIQGTVYLSFVIDNKGAMKDLEVLRGVSGGCTEEAIRVLKSMEEWCPGKNNGIPVAVKYKVPIKFSLRN